MPTRRASPTPRSEHNVHERGDGSVTCGYLTVLTRASASLHRLLAYTTSDELNFRATTVVVSRENKVGHRRIKSDTDHVLHWQLVCSMISTSDSASVRLCWLLPKIRWRKGGLVRITEGVEGDQLCLVRITQTGHLNQSEHLKRVSYRTISAFVWARDSRPPESKRMLAPALSPVPSGRQNGLSLAMAYCSPALGVLQATR
jgi:hypothetical protein